MLRLSFCALLSYTWKYLCTLNGMYAVGSYKCLLVHSRTAVYTKPHEPTQLHMWGYVNICHKSSFSFKFDVKAPLSGGQNGAGI